MPPRLQTTNYIFILLMICKLSSAQQSVTVYPTAREYLSVVNPIATFNKHGTTFNFSPSYTIGFPVGSKSAFTVWTTSNLRPCNESFFTVATTVPITRASCIFYEPLTSTVSMTPTIAASTGTSFIPCASRALDPATTSTRS